MKTEFNHKERKDHKVQKSFFAASAFFAAIPAVKLYVRN